MLYRHLRKTITQDTHNPTDNKTQEFTSRNGGDP